MVYALGKGVRKNLKNRIINLSAVFVLLTASLSGVTPFLTQKAFAAGNIEVCQSSCGSGTYSTIQAGIDAAHPGDTVTIDAGNYDGSNISVNQSVSLVGEPGAIVTVPNVNGTNGFSITADNVSISDLDIVGPADGIGYTSYVWGGTVTRGIVVNNGVTNFSITNNTIKGLRNDVLIDGRNTGSLTNNTIDNSKSGVSVQYTDAGTGNSEGYNIDMSGNHDGAFGNEWGLNTHLNGHYAGGIYYSNAQKIAADAPSVVQQALLANSTANGGWTVQDQGYSNSNRTAVSVATTGADTNQGSLIAPLATIPAAVASIVSGGTADVTAGTYTVTTANTVNKKVDIEGQGTPTIDTNGSNQIFTFTAAGSKLNGFNVVKTDNADQNIIGIQANDTSITNNDFSGQFTIAAGAGTTRALEVSSTAATGLNVSGNTFNNLRQPAYINNAVTGTIANNYVNQTKGWVVVSDTNLTFTGNRWGTNAGGTDIAIISQDGSVNNYTCPVMAAIRSNNNNAVIDNQVMTTACPITEAPNLIAPANGAVVKGASITNSWSSVVGATKYEYQSFNDAAGNDLRYDSTFTTTSKTATNVTDGTVFYWRVRAINSSGVAGPWSNGGNLWKVTVDDTKPSNINITPAGDSLIHGTVTFDVTDSDANPSYIYVELNHNGTWITDNTHNGTEGSTHSTLTYDTTHLSDGTYTIKVDAVDKAGNTTEKTYNYTVDNTAPGVAINSPANGSIVGGTVPVNVTLTGTDLQAYNLRVDNSGLTYVYQPSNGAQPVFNWNTSGLSDGTHTLLATATDKAGNKTTVTYTINVDNAKPAITANITDGQNLHGTVNLLETVSDANPLAYNIRVLDSHGNLVSATPGAYQNPVSGSTLGYSWNTDQPGVPDGTYKIQFSAKDKAGNSSTVFVTVNVDNDAPSTPSANPAGGTYTTTQLVSLSSDDSGSGLASIYYTTDGTTPSDSNGTLYNGAFSVSSSETVKAIAYDNTGNESGVMEEAYTINNTSPGGSLTGAAPTGNTFTTSFVQGGQGGSGGGGAGAGGNGGTAGNSGTGGQVLGASTTTPNTTSNTSGSGNSGDDKGNVGVEGSSTNKDNVKKSAAFLGLGWWWLLVLVLAGLLVYGLTRSANSTDKSN